MTRPGRKKPDLPAYATSPRPKRVKRVRLAVLVASFAACLSVTLIGIVFMSILKFALNLSGGTSGMFGHATVLGGVELALQLSSMNFFLFFITVPAAALALGLSIGRLAHRGIRALAPYLRWGAIWGAILVGGTTFAFGLLSAAAAAAGALITGLGIGGLAGAFCGFLVHWIIAPPRQLAEMDISAF